MLRNTLLGLTLAGLALSAAGCAVVPLDGPKEESFAVSAAATSTLGRLTSSWLSDAEGESGYYLLEGGHESLAARLWLIGQAERSIDAQYFIRNSDEAGQIIAREMLLAADRGVRIRFLLDDFYTSTRDEQLAMLDAHPNIEVRMFNPIARRGSTVLNFFGHFRHLNRRMHNKSFTVDNQMSIVGGRNIADEYFELDADLQVIDLDVMAAGPVVQEISGMFDAFWNDSRSVPIGSLSRALSEEDVDRERQELETRVDAMPATSRLAALRTDMFERPADVSDALYAAPAEFVTDQPEKLELPFDLGRASMFNYVTDAIRTADEEVIVVSPYLVPGDEGVDFWRSVVAEDVRVVMVTNSLASTNRRVVHAGYSRYRRDLLNVGVELHEVRATATEPVDSSEPAERVVLHAKLVVLDRQRVLIGSMNMDPRSIRINTEMGLMIESDALADHLAGYWLNDMRERLYALELNEKGSLRWHGSIDGEDVEGRNEPHAGLWARIKALFSKIVPEGQL